MKAGLQILLGFYSLVYLYTAGVLFFLGDSINGNTAIDPTADAQIRAISAPFLLVCLVLWWIIPNIEKHVGLLRLICLALVVGASARLVSYIVTGQSDGETIASMITDFAFPLVLVWQQVVIKRSRPDGPLDDLAANAAARSLP